MKVIFVGPSLPDAASVAGDGIIIRPPAVQGDVAAALRDGASVIGIVDGGFEYTAPVWHKEILLALSQNVPVYGASSMGALRAAECRAFGMIGVGRIFEEYMCGATVDDADVALLHAPAEFGWKPLTVPLVNVRATLDRLEAQGALARDTRLVIETAAAQIFFKERTWRSVVDGRGLTEVSERKEMHSMLVSNAVDQKRIDALALLEAVRAAAPGALRHEMSWQIAEMSFFSRH
ncbi:TfuA-like protein [Rhizobium sp. S96]|uniref:TfuA-like protein n=1 Tax=Rhizobium sp. S96 TaxID=3055140 RepID=UPI0025AB4FC7|nr:TfuA-like protein [Rhizobium sp. S96]MDM9620598.1 TfuA-like protein [Rhizobium sp. S96]